MYNIVYIYIEEHVAYTCTAHAFEHITTKDCDICSAINNAMNGTPASTTLALWGLLPVSNTQSFVVICSNELLQLRSCARETLNLWIRHPETTTSNCGVRTHTRRTRVLVLLLYYSLPCTACAVHVYATCSSIYI